MDAPFDLLVRSSGIDCDAYTYNATLGPLGIDYVYLHYCTFAGVPLVSAAVLLLWLAVLFYFLGSTADGYFSPTLASMSELLHVPYDIAGVTFLAFGNGAPDVFASIAAYSTGVADAGVNELLGGAMFVTTVVVGAVALASDVRVASWPVTRDVSSLVLALALVVLLATLIDVATNAFVAMLLLLAAYVLYVSTVLVPECVARYRSARAAAVETASTSTTTRHAMLLRAFWHAPSPRSSSFTPDPTTLPYAWITRTDAAALAGDTDATNFELAPPTHQQQLFPAHVDLNHFDASMDDDASASDALTAPLLSNSECLDANDTPSNAPMAFTRGAGIVASAYWRHLRWRWRVKRRVRHAWRSSDSLAVQLLLVPHALLTLVRDGTIPLLDSDAWSRPLASLSLLTVPLFLLLLSDSLYLQYSIWHWRLPPLWQLACGGGSAAALVVLCSTHRQRPPSALSGALCLLVLAFIACVGWIFAVASELMALLVAIGVVTNARPSLLGLTVLAWGNSVGDLVTNVSVARAGFPQMAIAGCFGGPVFNLLVGLGLPIAVAIAQGDALELALDDHAVVSLAFLTPALVATWSMLWRCNWRCPPAYGRMLIGYYVVYTIGNIAMALREKWTSE